MTDRDFRALVAHLRETTERLRAAVEARDPGLANLVDRLRRWERDVEGSIDLELGRRDITNRGGG